MARDGKSSNVCLTLHQPWASLLVAGIKRVEGRNWSAPHRGRLWIHAAAKIPTDAQVAAVEDQYRSVYAAEGVERVTFPTAYPTSCLLGCVDVAGCLTKEDFQAAEDIPVGPKLESESEFVFLCKDPRQLVLPFSLSGQHKLWKLDNQTREAAEGGLGSVVTGPSPVVFSASP